MEMDERGLYGIYSTWHVPFWQTTVFYWLVVCLVSLVVLGLAFFLIRWIIRRRRAIPITPWDYALQRFASLELHPCASKADGKQFYSSLSYEMKQYVHKRYSYDVRWKTDEELISFLEKHEFPEPLLADLNEIMTGSMLVKFANIEVIQEQIKRHLALSKAFVQKTIPQQNR